MTFLHLWLKLHLFYYLTLYFIYMTLKFCSTIGLETTRLQWKTCCNHKGSELELFTTLHCITTCFLRQDHVGKKAIHRFFFAEMLQGFSGHKLIWVGLKLLHCITCVWWHLWPFSHPARSFLHIKALTVALVFLLLLSLAQIWDCGHMSWTQDSWPALQGRGLCRGVVMCSDMHACLSACPM